MQAFTIAIRWWKDSSWGTMQSNRCFDTTLGDCMMKTKNQKTNIKFLKEAPLYCNQHVRSVRRARRPAPRRFDNGSWEGTARDLSRNGYRGVGEPRLHAFSGRPNLRCFGHRPLDVLLGRDSLPRCRPDRVSNLFPS